MREENKKLVEEYYSAARLFESMASKIKNQKKRQLAYAKLRELAANMRFAMKATIAKDKHVGTDATVSQ